MRKSPRDGPGPGTGRSVYQIKVVLLHSRPPIWRRLQIESNVTLDRLHDTLQMMMGWTNSHLHGFRVPQPSQRGTRRRLLPIDRGDEKATRLDALLRRPKDWLVYDYDFGDSWEHEVLLGAIRPPRVIGNVRRTIIGAPSGGCNGTGDNAAARAIKEGQIGPETRTRRTVWAAKYPGHRRVVARRQLMLG